MAGERTQISELGTAAGIVLGDDHEDLELLDALEMPGIPDSDWRPPLEAARDDWHRYHPILRASLANGAAFRSAVLKGRDPDRLDWRGGNKTMLLSDAPVDLRVNDVYLVSAKYDSVCLLNGSPASVFDRLLSGRGAGRAQNWFSEIATQEYERFFDVLVAEVLADAGEPREALPARPQDLTRDDRVHLKYLMKRWPRGMPDDARSAYEDLCRSVSDRTADRWRSSLASASEATILGMLAQMTRLCGTVYWLLGQSGERPVRCRVSDTVEWRRSFRLRKFDVTVPLVVGQPRVDWRAVLDPRGGDGDARIIEGYCEVRWSHGKFQGSPECKVQLRTPVWELPGYQALL